MNISRIIITAVLLLILPAIVFSQDDSISSAPEKILFNAKIFTADKNAPFAEAVSIRADKIVATGDYETVKKTVAAGGLQIDMHGAFLMSGLIDSHEHAIEGGEGLTRANTFDSLILGDALTAFADSVQRNGTGMVNGFLIIDGINITTW